jgi:hypothetical protein
LATIPTFVAGDVLSAANMNLISTAAQQGSRNAIINGGFDIWQRGTSTAVSTSAATYLADRFFSYRAGFAAGATVSRQSSGLTGIQYAYRVSRDSGNSSTAEINTIHNIETANSIGFAGQPVTVSFYARKGANYSAGSSALGVRLISGTGTDQSIFTGYTGQADLIYSGATLTTSWQRFTYTATVTSSATEIGLFLYFGPTGTAGAADYYEITGIQLEAGSVATPFSRAGGTLQGELAACQRYYYRSAPGQAYGGHGMGQAWSTTASAAFIRFPVTMRTVPSAIDYSVATYMAVFDGITRTALNGNPSYDSSISSPEMGYINVPVASGLTTTRTYTLQNNNNASGFIGFSSEL